MKYAQWGVVHSHVQWELYNHPPPIYNLRIYACRCVYVPLTVYFWHTPEDIIVAVSSLATFFFFSWPLSTSAVNTNKYVRIWAHTTNAYKLSQTFRRPERLTCDLIQLQRSVKQAVCDEETFLSWVASTDASEGIDIRWIRFQPKGRV